MAEFILTGTTVADPLGVWHTPVSAGTAFSQTTAEPAEPRWTIRLEAEPAVATRALQAQQARLRQRQTELRTVQHALDQAGEPVSFAAAPGLDPALVEPGRELAATLARFRHPLAFGGSEEPAPPAEQAAAREWSAFVTEAQRLLAHYTHVQTEQAGVAIGLTTVNWSGDFRTTWAMPVAPASRRLHVQAVETALASRAAWLQLIATVTGGAIGLAAKAALPGGAVLLLPAAWRFVRDVLAAWHSIAHQA